MCVCVCVEWCRGEKWDGRSIDSFLESLGAWVFQNGKEMMGSKALCFWFLVVVVVVVVFLDERSKVCSIYLH